jgi:L-tyrosine isonitrile synthase
MSGDAYKSVKSCEFSTDSRKKLHGSRVVSAENIVAAFNTWSFKREQPSSLEALTQSVRNSVSLSQPVEFVLYWGKGPRSAIAPPDEQCLDYLVSMRSRIQAIYQPGAEITLVLTDTHASLNGHSATDIQTYFTDISNAARQRALRSSVLSTLVQRAPMTLDRRPSAVITARTAACLNRSADRWFKGCGTPIEGAAAYYAMNMLERDVVGAAFPAAISITFNGSGMRELFPQQLPIFYMYALRKGFGVKPWFLDATGRSYQRPEYTDEHTERSAVDNRSSQGSINSLTA